MYSVISLFDCCSKNSIQRFLLSFPRCQGTVLNAKDSGMNEKSFEAECVCVCVCVCVLVVVGGDIDMKTGNRGALSK